MFLLGFCRGFRYTDGVTIVLPVFFSLFLAVIYCWFFVRFLCSFTIAESDTMYRRHKIRATLVPFRPHVIFLNVYTYLFIYLFILSTHAIHYIKSHLHHKDIC